MNTTRSDSGHLLVPVRTDPSEWLVFDRAGTGWAKVVGTDAADETYVRIGSGWARQSELLIQQLLVCAGRISGPTVRALPLSQIAAAINRPAHYDLITQHLTGGSGALRPFPESEEWSTALPVALADPVDLRLEIPAHRSHKPDSFYAAVAERFAYQSTVSNRPSRDLAETNGVEFTTMHRWVREARNRGLLPKHARSRRSGR